MLSIQDQFKYHPPRTGHRLEAHQMINSTAADFAQIFSNYCPTCTEYELQHAIDLVQQARMYMNQVITYKEVENG